MAISCIKKAGGQCCYENHSLSFEVFFVIIVRIGNLHMTYLETFPSQHCFALTYANCVGALFKAIPKARLLGQQKIKKQQMTDNIMIDDLK